MTDDVGYSGGGLQHGLTERVYRFDKVRTQTASKEIGMAQVKRSFVKDSSDCDTTLDMVLQDIEARNKDGEILITFSIQPGDVILFYEKYQPK